MSGLPAAIAATQRFEKAPKQTIQADYKFTDSEKLVLGQNLAGLMQKKEEIAAKKKDLMAQINAQAEQCTAEIKGLSNKLHSGFEVRPTDCYVLFNDPEKGQKSFYAVGTHDRVKTELMLSSDYEQDLPMDGLEPTPAPTEAPAKKSRKKAAGTTPAEAQADAQSDAGMRDAARAAGAPPVDPALEDSAPGSTPIPPAGTGEEGTTNIGEALQRAAAGRTLPKVVVSLSEEFPADKARSTWRKAARKVWPEAAVDLIDEQCLEVMDDGDPKGSLQRVLAILRAHSEGEAP